MFATLVRRLAQTGKEPVVGRVQLNINTNPYQARKLWPPNMSELTPQQQLRLEKKYKRRVNLARHSPRWIKGTKYAQLILSAVVVIYMTFWADFEFYGQPYKPSDQLRDYYNNIFGVMDPEKRYDHHKDASQTGVSAKEQVSERK